jgi:O-antigen ligase
LNTESFPQNQGIAEHLHNNLAFLALFGACLILLGFLVSQVASPQLVFGIVGVTLACIFVPTSWPLGALVVLIIASVMPRLSVEIGGWNARPEHCAAFLVLLIFLLRLMFHDGPRISLTLADVAVASYVVWNYVSSVWMSPDPKSTLRWALLNNLVILPYFLIRFLVTDERTLRWVFRAFVAVGIAECVFAVLVFLAKQFFTLPFGTETDQYVGGLGGVYGTQYEPNLLGSYAGCLAIILLVLYFLSRRKPRWIIFGVIISLSALLVSLSRAAFIGFLFVAVLLLFVGVRVGLISLKKILPLGLVLALFVAPFAVTGGRSLLSRFSLLSAEGVENDSQTVGRLVAIAAAFEDIAQHPVVGNGTASFQLLADAKQLPILGDRPWVGNTPVRVLHDTGIIGLLLMGAVVAVLGRSVWRAMAAQNEARDIVCALAAGCLVYAITFMSTEGTMLAFFWVHIGVLASACLFASGPEAAAQSAG